MNALADRKKLQRELAEDLREKDRAALGLLRAQIKHARVERKGMLRVARQSCHTARAELKQRQAVQRTEFVQAQRVERVLERTACSTGKASAKAKGLELELGARRTLKDERAFQTLAFEQAEQFCKPEAITLERWLAACVKAWRLTGREACEHCAGEHEGAACPDTYPGIATTEPIQ